MLSKGAFLVADEHMRDPRFFKTVIVLLDYGPDGAVGLIVNRPTKFRLSATLPGIKGLKERNDPLYYGGPVGTRQLSILVRSSDPPEEAAHVFGDLYVSSSTDLLERLLEEKATGEVFRVYAGYAGWAPAQLDREVAQGGWHVLRAGEDSVFGLGKNGEGKGRKTAPGDVWQRLRQTL